MGSLSVLGAGELGQRWRVLVALVEYRLEFPASTRWFTTIHNSSARDSKAHFLLPRAPGSHMKVCNHTVVHSRAERVKWGRLISCMNALVLTSEFHHIAKNSLEQWPPRLIVHPWLALNCVDQVSLQFTEICLPLLPKCTAIVNECSLFTN